MQKVNTQNNWVILQIALSGRKKCELREEGDLLFIGGKEGGNPTSNRCGIPNLSKSNRFPLSERNIRQKTSVDLEDHKASDSDLDLKDHKASDSDSDLEDHKVSDSDSNISIFCYGFRYASANPVF